MKRRVDRINSEQSLDSYRSKGRKNGLRIFLTVLSVVLSIVIVFCSVGYIYIKSLLSNIERVEVNEESIGVTSEAEKIYEDYTNIALFGLDTREKDDEGRSDAIMIVSIDRVHGKIKLTSIARDSYVKIERKGKVTNDKITHAWMYGKHELAIKTLNQNYRLNITDFVSMNFYQFAEIIDYIGGVDIDVSRSEKNVMNEYYIPYLNSYGIKCEYITKTGMQHLSGGQALAYSRNRYTGSDIDRGNRQREVIMAMYDQVKTLPVSKFPTLIKKVLAQCTTSMTDSEMLDLATWAATAQPEFEQLGLPTELKTDMINGISYVVYDLDDAAIEIRNFIHETGNYAPSKKENSSTVSGN